MHTKNIVGGIAALSLCLALVGAGCSGSDTSKKSDAAANDPVVTFSDSGVSIDCPASGWTCSSKYGGALNPNEGSGLVKAMKMFTPEASAEYSKLLDKYKQQGHEVVEEYRLHDGKAAILTDAANGRTKLMYVAEVKGVDAAVQCLGNTDTAIFEEHKAAIEEMCGSMKAAS